MTTPHLAIVITGPVGAGKTTIMSSLTSLLEEQFQPCAGVDMDHLRWFYPKEPGDHFGGAIGRKHLAYLAASYRSLGIPVLVIADVVEHDNDRRAMAAALEGYDLHVVRLRVPMHLLENRLRQRESEENLPWYLNRAPELERIMNDANVGDTIIDVGERDPRDVAVEIAERLHLL